VVRALAGRSIVCALVWLVIVGGVGPTLAQAQDEVGRLPSVVDRLGAQRKLNEAIATAEQDLESVSSRANPEAQRAEILDRLGRYYKSAGDLSRAEDRYRRALAVRRQLNPNAMETAVTLNNLARVLQDRAHFSEAEKLYQESLTIRKNLRDQMAVAIVLNNLGLLYMDQSRFSEAEPLLWDSLDIRKKAKGPTSEEVATGENNLALLYFDTGRFALTEQSYKRAIAIREQRLGRDDPLVGTTLGGLAVLYRIQGRFDEAEPLFDRAADILDARLRPDHPDIGTNCNNFGNLRLDQGRYEEAETLYRRALTIRQKLNNTPTLVTTAVNLARLLAIRRFYPESEALLAQALALVGRDFGPDSLRASVILNALGGLAIEQSRLSVARQFFERALTIREKAVGPDHPDLVQSLGNLGGLYYLDGKWAESAGFFRRATQAAMSRSRRGGNPIGGGVLDTEQDNLELRGRVFGLFVQAAYRLAVGQGADSGKLQGEGFEAAQWALESSAASSLAQASARQGRGDPDIASVIRERQDLAREWQSKNAYLVRSFSQNPDQRDSTVEQEFRTHLAAIENRISEIDEQLRRDFPKYAALIQPRPLSVQEVQAELGDSEALVNILNTESVRSVEGETVVWVVTRTDARWTRVGISRAALDEMVLALRCGLDEREWEGIEHPARCRRLLGIESKPRLEDPLPFNLAIAYRLYRDLLGPFEDLIKDKHLLIVPSGPLTSLPFQVLVTKEPSAALPKGFAGYKEAAWLARRQPLTVLPSVASLQALRAIAGASRGQKAYLAYGNPALLGDGSCPTGRSILEGCAPMQVASADGAIRARAGQRSGDLDRLYRRGASQDAVLAEVRSLCPLPDTAIELRCVARTLGVPESEIRLGASASESDIKQLSASGELANYRVVHFATHGLLAGDIDAMARRQGEPALVLTPPATPQDADDDGLLTASEVAQLKLNADWVILSACNTAAGDKPGAEALSGLARAFFYAGARTLLVSHWPVYSDAAVQLLDLTFAELRAQPEIDRSEAFRRAMIALIDDPAQDDNPHPSVWAPFSVIGEGGKLN
jgi:CHAT domain-containing protein/Tfp pilus assembly protein PilF